MMISNRSSAAVRGNLRMPKSSMMSSGTVATDSMNCLRLPSDSFGEFLQQDMRLPIDDAIVLLDGSLADGLSQVTFPRSAWTQEKCIFPLADEGTGGQVKHQAAIHLRVEGEIEVVQSLVRVAEAGLFAPAIQESLAAAGQFVAHQTGDQIDRRHGFGLRLMQSGFQHGGGGRAGVVVMRVIIQ